MQADCTTPQLSEVRAAWESYRTACFMRPGPLLVWTWAAAHDFDFPMVGLHLAQLPGARFDLGTHALSLAIPHEADADLQEWHLVPLTRLTKSSLDALQSAAAGDFTRRVADLAIEQRHAQDLLDQQVKQRHLWRLLPGSADGTVQ